MQPTPALDSLADRVTPRCRCMQAPSCLDPRGSHSEAALQVLVYHDLLGMLQHPHHAKVTPKFCKQFAQVGTVIQDALTQYRHAPKCARKCACESCV